MCLVPGAWCLVPGAWCLVPGAWWRGGGPSQQSCECLSILAQILKMPIVVYFRTTEDGEEMVKSFEP
jgi:hypothetical protein